MRGLRQLMRRLLKKLNMDLIPKLREKVKSDGSWCQECKELNFALRTKFRLVANEDIEKLKAEWSVEKKSLKFRINNVEKWPIVSQRVSSYQSRMAEEWGIWLSKSLDLELAIHICVCVCAYVHIYTYAYINMCLYIHICMYLGSRTWFFPQLYS